jgi:hypothetical protein
VESSAPVAVNTTKNAGPAVRNTVCEGEEQACEWVYVNWVRPPQETTRKEIDKYSTSTKSYH